MGIGFLYLLNIYEIFMSESGFILHFSFMLELSVIVCDSDVQPTIRSKEPKYAELPPSAVTLTKKWYFLC